MYAMSLYLHSPVIFIKYYRTLTSVCSLCTIYHSVTFVSRASWGGLPLAYLGSFSKQAPWTLSENISPIGTPGIPLSLV